MGPRERPATCENRAELPRAAAARTTPVFEVSLGHALGAVPSVPGTQEVRIGG
jgi:hypothetical protein